jgi:pyridoxine 5'-phosphate synthase PdxJ
MAISFISYTIDTTTCGENNYQQNVRYADAVRTAIDDEFNCNASVFLSERAISSSSRCAVVTDRESNIGDERWWEDTDVDSITEVLEEIDSATTRVRLIVERDNRRYSDYRWWSQ